MKKLLLFFSMLFLSITSYAYDIAVENTDGKTIYYNYTNDGQELEVTYGNAPYSGMVNIPETVTFMNRTRRVTSIRSFAFYYSQDITSITIPCTVTFIGKSAFSGCNKLTSVHISDIAAWCKIIFEKPYTSNPLVHARHLYMNDEEIKDLVIPNDVKSIAAGAFYGCFGLTSATIPEGVTEIGESAFADCRNIVSISFPSSVKSIGVDAFEGCDIPIIVSRIENPSAIFNNTFTQNTFNNATLYVPEGTIEKYKATDGWNNFTFIETINELESRFFKLSYTVDGEEYKVHEIKYGMDITPEIAPEREGYTFSGWSDIPESMPPHDVAVTSSFTINTYTLTYIVDGEVYKASQVDFGTPVVPEELPTKTGYTFSGWSEILALMPAMDVTINGTFTINNYKLTYVVDGVEYKTIEVEYNSEITPEAEPTKEGHSFSGWSDIPETMPANDVSVIGSFIVNKYQVTYIIDSEVFSTEYVEYGTTIVPPCIDDKEGFTFSGWSEIPETMPAHDITIYGNYTSGIAKIVMAAHGEARIYSPNGKKIDRLQKGLNIVVLADGTVKKIVVR